MSDSARRRSAGSRPALRAVAGQLDVELPRYLPVAGVSRQDQARWPPRRDAGALAQGSPLDLSALLSQVLLAFTIDFERESRLSLAISANALRVLGEQAVRVRDLPGLTGVSTEAVAVSALPRYPMSIRLPGFADLGHVPYAGCPAAGP